MIIYKAQNKINGDIYIGQTIKVLKKRIQIHIRSKACPLIHRALLKYGIENFDIRIIDTAKDMNELNELEVKYIKKYDCIAPNGYNLTAGGLNYKKTEEHKRKISESGKGEKNWNYGKSISKEVRKKISEAHKGKEA